MRFYPYKKVGGEGEKSFSHPEGDKKSFGVVLTRVLEVLAILMGVRSAKRVGGGGRARKVLPCLERGGAQKVLDPLFSHFVAPPPLPLVNDPSLKLL